MKYDVAMKWVEALRSGKYKQTKDALQKGNSYCCLGVLCEIAPKSLVIRNSDNIIEGGTLDSQSKVKTWSGIKSGTGDIEGTDLASLNDSGVTIFDGIRERFNFDEIADIIQCNWRKL